VISRHVQGHIKVLIVLWFSEGVAICGRTYSCMELEQRDGNADCNRRMYQLARAPPWLRRVGKTQLGKI